MRLIFVGALEQVERERTVDLVTDYLMFSEIGRASCRERV